MANTKLLTLTLALVVFGVAGCAQSKVATVFEKDNSQLALALNKNGSVTVLGVNDGERVKPCEVPAKPLNPREADNVGGIPTQPLNIQEGIKAGEIPDDRAIAHCFPDGHVPGEILFQQNYTIGVRKGSLCIYVWNNGKLYVYCNPPHNISYSGH